jgi:2-polyprenyl-6-methoxyphenol hydroxylase-like FAD-dependent oxidoreductase
VGSTEWMENTVSPVDVIVIGAGPTGLMIASELALAGVHCRVLERRAEQPNITRAFAVHARTLELLDARGVADDLLTRGVPVQQIAPAPGATLDLRELDTRYPMILIAPQSGTEHVLEARARRLGVEIVYGADVVALREDGDDVVLDVDTGGITGSQRAHYVVGCDGAHSAVRRMLGVDFVGKQYQTHILLADVRLPQPPAEAMFARNNDQGVVICVPFGDGWFRVIAWDRLRAQAPLEEPVTADEMRDAFRRIAGTDFGMSDPRWSSRFLSERRQARHYRVGRVFLAGDAAHVHSPLGGQGMNTGIQDAVNLGWKLAGAVHGWAPPWLLDSYEGERHPVGAQVLKLTDGFNQLMLGRSRIRRSLQAFAIGSIMRFRRPRLAMAGRLTGLGIGYPPRHRGEHRWVGRRMPDMNCADGRLYELLRDGRFVLVDATGTALLAAARDAAGPVVPAQVSARWSDRVRTVQCRPGAAPGLPGVVLVRPDGYVAWACDRPSGDDVVGAVSAWCGPAAFADEHQR